MINYTTNDIKSVNSQISKVIKPRGSFPTDDAAIKFICLAKGTAAGQWLAP